MMLKAKPPALQPADDTVACRGDSARVGFGAGSIGGPQGTDSDQRGLQVTASPPGSLALACKFVIAVFGSQLGSSTPFKPTNFSKLMNIWKK